MKARLQHDGWPLLLLLAAAIAFFWKVTLGGKVLLPAATALGPITASSTGATGSGATGAGTAGSAP